MRCREAHRPAAGPARAPIIADERHDEVYIAWQCAQQLRSVYKAKNPAEGRRIAEKGPRRVPTCRIPETKRLGKTLKQ